jgi:hypothetical protein
VVWRTFHDSLDFYSRSSAPQVRSLLTERASFTPAEAELVIAAGREYLQRLDAIDAAARNEILARFPPPKPQFSIEEVPRPTAMIPPADRIPRTVGRGQLLYEALLADGLIARVERQREEAFRQHKETLARTVGVAKLANLEQWLRADIAPSVKTLNLNDQPPPLPRVGAGSSAR